MVDASTRALAPCNFHAGDHLFCMRPAQYDHCQMLHGDFVFSHTKKERWTQSLYQKNMNVPPYSLLNWIASKAGSGRLNVAWAQLGMRYHSGTEQMNCFQIVCAACNRATE